MRSTFMGLETSKRGMFTQQSALYTTGHNISNANTLGYSRQRVNMEATLGYPGKGLNAPATPGYIGTGVQAQSVERIRDSFIDHQFRQESNKLGYWESRSQAISQMENVLNEPSEFGLGKSLNDFWKSLQDLSVNPENSGARSVVVQRAIAVADSFNYMHKSLTDIQSNLGAELNVSAGEVNTLLEQIADLNRQIKEVEPNRYLPNDLYDARDVLLDKLSTLIPIEVNYTSSGGNSLAIADGIANVSLKMKDGTTHLLVEGRNFGSISTDPSPLKDSNNNNVLVNGLSINTATGTNVVEGHAKFSDIGKLKSLMNSYGVNDGTADGAGLYPEMLTKLNNLAKEFADEFNRVHNLGSDLNGVQGRADFFVNENTSNPANITAGNISVHKDFERDESLVAASDKLPGSTTNPEAGNGDNALKLADFQTTIIPKLQDIIGKLGVDGQHAERLTFNTTTLRNAVEERRQSVSSVSLDEEMTNMIKFQQAYNASARMITAVDETLDKIINGMGRVGL